MQQLGESAYVELVRQYKRGSISFTPTQKKIFKAILRGREERVLRHKGELGEALYCTLVVPNEDLDEELKWWSLG